ncbi:MAG TPA: DUF4386 domain-containing protein [Acidimicrobiia bacterium]|nr:DUF4386 domain-containing protein [Acidimicrobiia bacterium]
MTSTRRPATPTDHFTSPTDVSKRKMALVAALGLLTMALLAPFVVFGVLDTLVVADDPAATFSNISASEGLFRSGIAAFLIVIMLDVVVAWALYVLLSPVNRTVALLTAWLRLAFAAVFASALINLLDAAQLVAGAEQSTLQQEQLHSQVASSIASFDYGWTGVALAIFGLHLFGLGYLLFKSSDFPKFLGALVILAGVGYLIDSFGTILVPGYALTIGMFTFVGEALLIIWLFLRAIRGFPSGSETGLGR